jgi:hypothetical protein
MSNVRIIRLGVCFVALSATMLVHACADQGTNVMPVPSESSETPMYFANAAPYFDETVAPAGDLHGAAADALRRTAWVGEIHRDALVELGRRIDGRPRTRAFQCDALARVLTDFTPRVSEASGALTSGRERSEAVRASVQLARPCTGYRAMSVFDATIATSSTTLGGSDLVSNTGLAYGDMVNDAVMATNGYRPWVDNAVYGVLNQAVANGLSAADIEYVAGVGNENISSSQYWTQVEKESGGRLPDVQPMIWGYVAIDAIGCGVNAGSAALGGERRVGHLLGHCALGAIGSSGGARLGLKLK